jgi:hypothetical protein
VDKMLVVTDRDGKIKAAARIDPNNELSPTEIEVKPDRGESLHEITVPEELQATGLEDLVNYIVVADPEPRLMKQ